MVKHNINQDKISAEDFVAIQNLLGRYQWLVDTGDPEGWASLFLDDGVFASGFFPEPHKGHAALKKVPLGMVAQYGDRMIHHLGSLHITYGATSDEAHAAYYNLVTTWMENEGARFNCMALYTVDFVRVIGEWKIKVAATRLL